MLQQLKMLYHEAQLAERPFLPLLLEVATFCMRTGLGPRYFVKAGMARSDFPDWQRGQHISKAKFNRALEVLNPPPYRKFTQHKLCEKALFRLLEVPTAPLLAYCCGAFGAETGAADEDVVRLTSVDALISFFLGQTGQRLCIKPLEGWGGVGVRIGVVEVRDAGPVFCQDANGGEMDANAVWSAYTTDQGKDGFIVEAHVAQARFVSELNPTSLNTLRVWALQGASGDVDVIGAYLRVGRVGAVVDNASGGGLMCPVTLDTGTLQAAISKQSPYREMLVAHPDHGVRLAGVVVEQWSDILAFCKHTLASLPQTQFAGLDIAVTDSGPLLIEANVVPDADGAAHGRFPSQGIETAAGTGR